MLVSAKSPVDNVLRWEVYPGLSDGHNVIITRIPVSGSRKQLCEACRCSPVLEDGGSGRAWCRWPLWSQKRQENHSSLETLEGMQPSGHQDFKPSKPNLNFWLPECHWLVAPSIFKANSRASSITVILTPAPIIKSPCLSLTLLYPLYLKAPQIIFGPSG